MSNFLIGDSLAVCCCRLQANAGPNTNGSQFFITLAPTPHLDGTAGMCAVVCREQGGSVRRPNITTACHFFRPTTPTPAHGRVPPGKHTIFGRVHEGMKVVQRLGLVPTGAEDRPVSEVRIISATVVPPSS